MELQNLLNLTDFLANYLGHKYEIVLYEMDIDFKGKLIDIKNNYISKQTIGSPIPDFILDAILSNEFINKTHKEFLVSTDNNESIIKNAVLYIKNTNTTLNYILSISNYDNVNSSLNIGSSKSTSLQSLPEVSIDSKKFDSINNIILNTSTDCKSFKTVIAQHIEEVLLRLGIDSLNLSYAQKSDIVEELFKMNIFNIKNSVKIVSEYLNISSSSMYRYIRKFSEETNDDDTHNFLI